MTTETIIILLSVDYYTREKAEKMQGQSYTQKGLERELAIPKQQLDGDQYQIFTIEEFCDDCNDSGILENYWTTYVNLTF